MRAWRREGAPTNRDCLVQFSVSTAGVEPNGEVFQVVACDWWRKGAGVRWGWEGWIGAGVGGGSSEKWRLQVGDLRVFMESNRPPSRAEGP